VRIDFEGRVAKMKLQRNQPLLPLIEAVINSLHSIEDANGGASSEIRIIAQREQSLQLGEEAERLAPIESFTVEDNGIGFTEENQRSFETSDSLYKQQRGGKGVGRLLWLKAFEAADIDSTFGIGNLMQMRKFRFALPDGIDTVPAVNCNAKERKTSVKLVGFKDPWKETAPRHLDKVATAIVEHCFLYFLRPTRPRMILTDGFETIDLNQAFDNRFAETSWAHTLTVKGQKLSLRGFRMRASYGHGHQLVLAADSREVVQYPLGKHVSNLQQPLTDAEGNSFWCFAVVQGFYLDGNVSDARTSFDIPDRMDAQDDLSGEPTLQDIRAACVSQIATDLSPFTQRIEEEKTRRLEQFVQVAQPKYRPFVNRYRSEVLAELRPNATEHEMDVLLHNVKSRKEIETRQEVRKLIDADVPTNEDEHTAKVGELLGRISDFEKSALAEYVVHRKLVLQLFEKSLQRNPETASYPLEKVVHDIVFPMRKTSDDEGTYDTQNLWIIDERLTFHSYLASDKPLSSVGIVENDSLTRPDILIFDRPFLYGASTDQSLTSILVIEFKRPVRENYDEDPVTQVYRIIRELRAGTIRDVNGRPVRPAHNDLPAYCYVIADITPALQVRVENMGATPTPDNLGYFGYNKNLNAYYEVVSYQKVLNDAKKRNHVLFEKLGLA
jgi:hypothetical protein